MFSFNLKIPTIWGQFIPSNIEPSVKYNFSSGKKKFRDVLTIESDCPATHNLYLLCNQPLLAALVTKDQYCQYRPMYRCISLTKSEQSETNQFTSRLNLCPLKLNYWIWLDVQARSVAQSYSQYPQIHLLTRTTGVWGTGVCVCVWGGQCWLWGLTDGLMDCHNMELCD